ncbi:tetratricopeptide repeat protein [uncultured Psychroserpens sp.]|uniref:tetratricopeptide repeat protein n=1 Tax=uncultured Psychroserpens sp. TaxID=255436 RepID=UPI002624C19D|nr:tetratricopeptide repeat protein [uncultured Psychroserpens sp.]
MKNIIFFLLCLSICFVSCKTDKSNQQDIITKTPPLAKYTCAPRITDADWYKIDNKAPLFEGLGHLNYPITTHNDLAQKYFNQGLTLAYAFNHAEAARSFFYATKLDPSCAMAFWGYAYVLGPNYNAGMEDDHYERAYNAIQKAKELSTNCTEKEKALIKAMAERYAPKPPEDRSQLDINYSNALKTIHANYPEDSEVSTMYAESVMNLHPWDLNEKDGTEKPWTPEIVSLLETIIKDNPTHPGANHFYIHAVEASSTPERAYSSAKVFDDGTIPGAGHLVHMPSHVYIRTGDYHKGTVSNINAVKADSTYVTLCHAQGAYPLAYYPHNYHFMAATAALEGNKHWAMIGANKVSEHVHPDIMAEPGWGTLQHYYVIPYYSMVKFGMWDEILAKKELSALKYPLAMQHYAKGMAYVAKDQLDEAKTALESLSVYANDDSMNDITIWDINTVGTLIGLAEMVLEAEILSANGDYKASITLLRDAIVIEDALNYNEPPDWFFSIRHHLGDVLIKNGQYEEAIAVYNNDLKRLPKNGWAHHGLKLAYEKLGDTDNVSKMEDLIKNSWATADIELFGSKVK